MPKIGSGAVAGAGARKGEFVGWNEGLTADDRVDIQVVADHTAEVLVALDASIARALEAIGIEAESDAAMLCPVDTGRLRNSITHSIDEGGKYAVVGTNVEYGKWVHEGTSKRKPQPFLRDAVNHNMPKYKAIFEAAMKS